MDGSRLNANHFQILCEERGAVYTPRALVDMLFLLGM